MSFNKGKCRFPYVEYRIKDELLGKRRRMWVS